MVYKKYIVKNGRTYGPYIYHSKRVDGKVVSEYRGHSSNINFKKISLIIFGLFFIFALIYFTIFFENKLTGQVALGLNANYVEGEPLTGNLRISIKQGELLPSSSKIILEDSNQTSEYILSDIISDKTSEGNFYVEGKEISGNGSGYGIEGIKKIYPEVSFTLNILNEASSNKTNEKNNTETETPTEQTSVPPETSEKSNETTSAKSIPEIQPEINQETQPIETTSETGEEKKTEKILEKSSETVSETAETISPENSPEATSSETSSETSEENVATSTEQTSETPVTGNVIGKLFQGFLGFFKFRGTGQVSLELDGTISGTTSADKPFSYILSEGQTVELVSSSQDVKVNVENGIASVTTDYFETENGFGSDYIGEETKLLEINLKDLNFIPAPGELKVKLIYGENEILLLNTNLSEGIVNNSVVIEQNITLNETEMNVSEITGNFSLSSSEIEILLKEFGNLSVETTKAEIFNGRIIIRFEIGKYWVEYSYDSDLSDDSLAFSIEKDRIKWLKDLAVKFSEEKNEPEKIEKLLGVHNITTSVPEENNKSIVKENAIINVNGTE